MDTGFRRYRGNIDGEIRSGGLVLSPERGTPLLADQLVG
jgi:hypothetical protein